MKPLPRFYAIADAGFLSRRGVGLAEFALELQASGVRLIQYRDKLGNVEEVAKSARLLRSIFRSPECVLILNDDAELAATTGCDGAHLGQRDLAPKLARAVLGPDKLIGVSTHNEAQVATADAGGADYIAVGPVFATASKENPDPVIGLDGVRRLRALTKRPLVAIGGITRANCVAAMEAGADSVAVISELLPTRDETTRQITEDFLSRLR